MSNKIKSDASTPTESAGATTSGSAPKNHDGELGTGSLLSIVALAVVSGAAAGYIAGKFAAGQRRDDRVRPGHP